MIGLKLTGKGEELLANFVNSYGAGDCSCHISAPCGSCLHPGNPDNLSENQRMWEPCCPQCHSTSLVKQNTGIRCRVCSHWFKVK